MGSNLVEAVMTFNKDYNEIGVEINFLMLEV